MEWSRKGLSCGYDHQPSAAAWRVEGIVLCTHRAGDLGLEEGTSPWFNINTGVGACAALSVLFSLNGVLPSSAATA